LPPEGDDNNNYDEYEDLAEEIKELAKEAAERLGNKNKYGRVFLFLSLPSTDSLFFIGYL
jgi:hypothetical protein